MVSLGIFGRMPKTQYQQKLYQQFSKKKAGIKKKISSGGKKLKSRNLHIKIWYKPY